MMDDDGINLTKLADHFNQSVLARGGWSPDGNKIAFSYSFGGDIRVLDLETGIEANLTRNPERDWWPLWSPDGNKIAFTSERDGHDEVYVMNADGSNQTRLTTYSGTVPEERGQVPPGYRVLAWSPDGKKILCSLVDFDANFDIIRWDIYVMDRDGENQINVTRDLPDGGGYLAPSWSPDGEMIVFSVTGPNLESVGEIVSGIYVVATNGDNLTRLTNNEDSFPEWAPQ